MPQNTSISTPKLLVQHGYRYLMLIGEGSNGKTYKALSLKTSEVVAIKELKFSESLKNYELFEREAETLKSIHTPGTPRFYDYITGEKEFTECWLVQEYVEGKSILDEMEDGQKFSEINTLQLMLQIADIVRMLQTMYTPPIIHRDIKPSNILMRNEAKDGLMCCLIDFGAVANPQRRGINSTVAGTVGYMAPEQLLGDCTIQSDYYALGATALHIMTGIAPSNFVSDGFKLQFEKQLKESVPQIHPKTIDLFHKLLAPNANDRPQNANELIKLITEALNAADDEELIRTQLQQKIKSYKFFAEPHTPSVGYTILRIFHYMFYGGLGGMVIVSIIISVISEIIGIDLLNLYSTPIFSCYLIMVFFAPIIYHYRSYKLEKLNKQLDKLNALPHHDNNQILEYKPTIAPENFDSGNTSKTIGTVQLILGDCIEYTVTIDHRCYSAFCSQPQDKLYKVGDEIEVQYKKYMNKYIFSVCT